MLERDIDFLLALRNNIKQFWGKDAYYHMAGPGPITSCLIGCGYRLFDGFIVKGRPEFGIYDAVSGKRVKNELHEIQERIIKLLDFKDWRELTSWNDHKNTTKEMVIDRVEIALSKAGYQGDEPWSAEWVKANADDLRKYFKVKDD
jgi:hypothetical protein